MNDQRDDRMHVADDDSPLDWFRDTTIGCATAVILTFVVVTVVITWAAYVIWSEH